MEKKINIKDFKSISQLSRKNNLSKQSKNKNFTKHRIQRKNKSELKLQTTYGQFLPLLGVDTYNNDRNIKNQNYQTMERKKSSTISLRFYNSKNSEELQKTLSFNRNRMLKNKTELNELKIQYNKLYEDNENNNKLLSKILNLRNIKDYSKEELLEKTKYCELDKKSKKKMLDTINLINLKLEVNEKKSILKSTNNEYEYLKEKSKYKNILELKKELSDKDEIKKQILCDIERLKEIISDDKKIMDESEEENKKLEEKYKNAKKEEKDILQKIQEYKERSIKLQEIIFKIERKLQKNEIVYKENCKTQQEINSSIKEKEKKIEDINVYLSKREQININVQKRRDIIKNYEIKNNELEYEYDKLNSENNDLMKKNN